MARHVTNFKKVVAVAVISGLLALSTTPAAASGSGQNEPSRANGILSGACKVISYIDEFDSVKSVALLLKDGDSKSSVLGTAISVLDDLVCPLLSIERQARQLRDSLVSTFDFRPPAVPYQPVGAPSAHFSSLGPHVLYVQWLQTTIGEGITTVHIAWRYASGTVWFGLTDLRYSTGLHEDLAYYTDVDYPCSNVVVGISATPGVWLYSLPAKGSYSYCPES